MGGVRRRRVRWATVAAAIASLLLAAQAGAATITVDTAADEDGDEVTSTGCALREALASAAGLGASIGGCDSGSAVADEIEIALPADATINLLATEGGQLLVNSSVSIFGSPGLDVVGAGTNHRVIFVPNAADTVSIDDLTVRGGRVTNATDTGLGAGIRNVGDLTLNDVVVTDNTVTRSAAGTAIANGGGIANAASGSLELNRTRVEGNQVSATTTAGTSTDAASALGGGILNNGILTLSFSTVAGNTATAVATGDQTADAQGGGIRSSRTLDADHSTISGNSVIASMLGSANTGVAFAQGGGLADHSNVADSADLELVTISGNRVIATAPNADPTVPLNYLQLGGGVIVSTIGGGTSDVVSSTIADNGPRADSPDQALTGANVQQNAGAITFRNSIVADFVGTGTNCDGNLTSLGHNIDDDATCDFGQGTDLPGIDPDLGPLQDNGGLTETMLPAAGSPVIDSGTNAGQLVDSSHDQRGFTRPSDFPAIPNDADGTPTNGTDRGAVELQAPPGPGAGAGAGPPPSNAFTLGELTRNKKKGTATLAVIVPGPGVLSLGGSGIKPRSLTVGAGEAELKIQASGKKRKRLNDKGKVAVTAEVTFAPTGGAPATQDNRLTLRGNR